MSNNKNFEQSQRGAGLLEVLIISGIMLIIFKFLMQSYTNANRSQKYEEMQLNRLFLKNYINESVDCAATVAAVPGSCGLGAKLKIIATNGDTLVESNGPKYPSKIGSYQVRARCGPGPSIDVQARLVNKHGKPVHPLRRNVKNVDDLWVSMFRNVAFKCTL